MEWCCRGGWSRNRGSSWWLCLDFEEEDENVSDDVVNDQNNYINGDNFNELILYKD